jgi:hypothetical protein
MMKKYIIILLSFGLIISCTDYDVSEYYNLKVLPGYVAYDAPGENATMDEFDGKSGQIITLTIEAPTGILSATSVTYEFGGDAVFGTNYTVAGATAAGGIIVIEPSVDTQNFDNVDLEVELLQDGVATFFTTLTVTLVSASNTEGTLAAGRGGTDFLKTATINIENTCLMSPAQMVGDWRLDMQDAFGDGWNGASVTFEVDGVGTDYDLDTYTTDGGSTGTVTITVPSGTTSLKFFFNSGDWDEEVTFQIIAPNAVEVGDYGISPAAGEFTIDACLL